MNARPTKIAVFCPNWVGDVVMATPTLRALRRQYPRAEIVAILRPYVAEVLTGLDLIDRMLPHAPWGKGTDAASAGWQFARRLRDEKFDLVLLLTNSFRSACWARISGAPRRVGFARDGRSWLLTEAVPPQASKQPHPVIDEYLRLAKQLGCRTDSRQMELAVDPTDRSRLKKFWRRQQPSKFAERGLVCLNPGGAFGQAKHWPAASFAELASRIATELERRVLVLCGPAEKQQARDIVRMAGNRAVVSLAEETASLGLTKAAVSQADLLVTTDSGPRHFAAPLGVPVVTLFGPTHTEWSETFYDKAVHLQLDVECGPCQQRVCPLKHHRCMRDLTVDWVFRAVAMLLQKYPARGRAA